MSRYIRSDPRLFSLSTEDLQDFFMALFDRMVGFFDPRDRIATYIDMIEALQEKGSETLERGGARDEELNVPNFYVVETNSQTIRRLAREIEKREEALTEELAAHIEGQLDGAGRRLWQMPNDTRVGVQVRKSGTDERLRVLAAFYSAPVWLSSQGIVPCAYYPGARIIVGCAGTPAAKNNRNVIELIDPNGNVGEWQCELRVSRSFDEPPRDDFEKVTGGHPARVVVWDGRADGGELAEDGEIKGLRPSGSGSGTFVNGQRVNGNQELKDGDVLTFGPPPSGSLHPQQPRLKINISSTSCRWAGGNPH